MSIAALTKVYHAIARDEFCIYTVSRTTPKQYHVKDIHVQLY